MLNINYDGRLIDRKLCGDSITLQEFMYTLYVGIAKRSDVKFILHKVANKISLLDAKITVVAKSSAFPRLNFVIKFAVVGNTIIKSAHLDNEI